MQHTVFRGRRKPEVRRKVHQLGGMSGMHVVVGLEPRPPPRTARTARAARAAGYSETSIYNISSENLTKPHIKQYIDFIKDDIATEAGLSKLRLIKELKILAFSNLTQILAKIETNGISSLTEEEQRVISEYEDTRYGIKIKTHDKRGAIQDILKAMGWNEADKLDLSSTDGSMSPKAIEVTVRKSDENKT